MKKLTIMEARKMSKTKLQTEIRKCSKYLENELGMEHTDACIFVSRVMNLGIAIQEKFDAEKSEIPKD